MSDYKLEGWVVLNMHPIEKEAQQMLWKYHDYDVRNNNSSFRYQELDSKS
jgi:hypothetical protein